MSSPQSVAAVRLSASPFYPPLRLHGLDVQRHGQVAAVLVLRPAEADVLLDLLQAVARQGQGDAGIRDRQQVEQVRLVRVSMPLRGDKVPS